VKFERIPEIPQEIEAEFFESPDIVGVHAFLENFGLKAEVEEVSVPGPGRSVSRGLKIRTIFQRESRTVSSAVPCWIAISGTEWIDMYSPDQFLRRFREKKG
jgi:hypothetical protein